ncbi:unnamed protein product, partial [Sphenostylis stenocarpa]
IRNHSGFLIVDYFCFNVAFVEPKSIDEALQDEYWIQLCKRNKISSKRITQVEYCGRTGWWHVMD